MFVVNVFEMLTKQETEFLVCIAGNAKSKIKVWYSIDWDTANFQCLICNQVVENIDKHGREHIANSKFASFL